MKYVFKTDVGQKRKNNEDFIIVKTFSENITLCIVADGLGGYQSGEVASKLASETIVDYFEKYYVNNKNKNIDVVEVIKRSIVSANNKVFRLEKTDTKYQGMGTTIALLCILNDDIFYSSVGDSRIYHIPDDFSKITQITEDDTYVNTLLKTNLINIEEASNHPQKHILTKAIGSFSDIQIDVKKYNQENSGIFIMCTDGVTNMLKDKEILEISKNSNFEEIALNIVDKSNKKGGTDNISIVAISLKED